MVATNVDNHGSEGAGEGLGVVTVRNAAKKLHVARDYAMKIARKHNLLIPMGEGEKRRHRRVDPEQLRLAILSEREYQRRRRPTSRTGEPLHPRVRC